jgi:hypothetical protein
MLDVAQQLLVDRSSAAAAQHTVHHTVHLEQTVSLQQHCRRYKKVCRGSHFIHGSESYFSHGFVANRYQR